MSLYSLKAANLKIPVINLSQPPWEEGLFSGCFPFWIWMFLQRRYSYFCSTYLKCVFILHAHICGTARFPALEEVVFLYYHATTSTIGITWPAKQDVILKTKVRDWHSDRWPQVEVIWLFYDACCTRRRIYKTWNTKKVFHFWQHSFLALYRHFCKSICQNYTIIRSFQVLMLNL